MRLQSFSLETGLPESERTAVLTFGKGPTETLFDNGFYGSLFSLCELPHFFIKTVWYLYGCLHMANHIILYGKISSKSVSPNLEDIVAYLRHRAGISTQGVRVELAFGARGQVHPAARSGRTLGCVCQSVE
jgi:hypothetical protein